MTNSAAAESAATDQVANRTTRRALLGIGVAGAALAASRSADAAPAGADVAAFAIGAELAAHDLYALADGELWGVLANSHRAFAERLAGISGVSASARNEGLYSAHADAFAGSDPAAAALALENTLVATHAGLAGMVDDANMVAAIASIVSAESRHAAVVADASGAGLDAILVNSAAALDPEA